jgi:hypothetical protein
VQQHTHAEARTRLLHWPPSRASIVAFALG